jgi:hypothetical protein
MAKVLYEKKDEWNSSYDVPQKCQKGNLQGSKMHVQGGCQSDCENGRHNCASGTSNVAILQRVHLEGTHKH